MVLVILQTLEHLSKKTYEHEEERLIRALTPDPKLPLVDRVSVCQSQKLAKVLEPRQVGTIARVIQRV